MFFFKALFVRIHEWLAPLVALWSLWQLSMGEWLWLAPLLAWAPGFIVAQWRVRRSNIAFLDDREVLLLTPALVGLALVLISGERDYPLWWTLAGLFGLLLNTVIMSKLSRGVREAAGDSTLLRAMTFSDPQGQPVMASEARLLLFIHSGWSPYSFMQLRDLEHFLAQNAQIEANSVALIFADHVPMNMPPLSRLQAAGVKVWLDHGDNAVQLGVWLRGASALRTGTSSALRPAMAVFAAGETPSSEGSKPPAFWSVANNVRLPPSASQHQARLLELLSS